MDTDTPDPKIDPAEIRLALKRRLEDEHFCAAPKMSAFLTYVVEQHLAGNAHRIKAYSIGVDALGKPSSFDAQDPSVRVMAIRLRAALDAYRRAHPSEPLHITLRPGSYAPLFERTKKNDA